MNLIQGVLRKEEIRSCLTLLAGHAPQQISDLFPCAQVKLTRVWSVWGVLWKEPRWGKLSGTEPTTAGASKLGNVTLSECQLSICAQQLWYETLERR